MANIESVAEYVGSLPEQPTLKREQDLNEALYSLSEFGLWPDNVDSVSEQQAILCWKLIEQLRAAEFPDSLKM